MPSAKADLWYRWLAQPLYVLASVQASRGMSTSERTGIKRSSKRQEFGRGGAALGQLENIMNSGIETMCREPTPFRVRKGSYRYN